MGSKNNEPSIRFIGFNDNWEQRKFGDLYKVSSGYAFKYQDYCDNGVCLINGESIQHGKIEESNINYLPEDFLNQYSNLVLKENDIVLGLNRPITNGNLKISKIPREFNDSLLYQRAGKINYVVNIDNDFSFVLLSQEILKHTLKEAVGSDQPFISTSKLNNWKMIIPKEEEERKKIGYYFSTLDNLITLHQRKCDNLEIFKKTLLDKLFPKNKETKPLYRFNGFLDDWEQRKLRDMGDTFTGLSGKTKEDFGKGEAEFITYLNVFNNPISNIKLTERVELDKKQNEVRYGDIFFTTSSETPGEVGMSSVWLDNRENVYLNSFCFGYRLKDKVDPFYMAYSLRSNPIRNQFILLAQGISRYNISKTKAMDIEIMLPKLDEQIKLGNIFKEIDNLITLHKRKLENLDNLKKYFLNNMFI